MASRLAERSRGMIGTTVRREDHLTQQQDTRKRVFIYCRVAAEDAARLDEQERGCRDYSEANEFMIIAVFRVTGSGNTLDHEELTKMRERYKAGEVDGIVVLNPTRLA